MVLQMAKKCTQTAYCEISPALEGQTHAKKRCNRAEMRGQTRKADLWCELQHSWNHRSASTWPKVGASLDEGHRAAPSRAALRPRRAGLTGCAEVLPWQRTGRGMARVV